MRQLSLTQPWATLMAIGAKRIETRSWRTSYTGEVAIHAALGLHGFPCHSTANADREEALSDLCSTPPFLEALEGHYGQFFRTGMLPRGAIVAVGTLIACEPVESVMVVDGDGTLERERAFGDYSPGRYAWLFGDVHQLVAPYPVRGRQGLSRIDGTIHPRQIRERL